MTGRSPPSRSTGRCPAPVTTDSDVRTSSCTVRGLRPRTVAMSGGSQAGRPLLAAGAVEDRPLHRRLAGLADRDRGPAPVARLTQPAVHVPGRPPVGDRPLELPARDPQQLRRVRDRVRRASTATAAPRTATPPRRSCRCPRRPSGRAAPRRPASSPRAVQRRSASSTSTVSPSRSGPRWPMSVCSSRVRTTSSMPRWYPTVVHSAVARTARTCGERAADSGDPVRAIRQYPSMRRCVCRVRPSSKRVSRCLP